MDGCQFHKRKFQVAAGSPDISQDDWDRAFRTREQAETEDQETDEGGRREESCPESTEGSKTGE